MKKSNFTVNQIKEVLMAFRINEHEDFIACTQCDESNGSDVASVVTKDNFLVNIFYCEDCNKLSFQIIENDD